MCTTSLDQSYLWQDEGREEGQWGWTLSQATQPAKLGPDPDSGGPLPSLGRERRLSGSASFNTRNTKEPIHFAARSTLSQGKTTSASRRSREFVAGLDPPSAGHQALHSYIACGVGVRRLHTTSSDLDAENFSVASEASHRLFHVLGGLPRRVLNIFLFQIVRHQSDHGQVRGRSPWTCPWRTGPPRGHAPPTHTSHAESVAGRR